MAKYASTETTTLCNTAESAVTALGVLLEAVDNDKTVQTCTVIRIEADKYLAVLVVTDAVA